MSNVNTEIHPVAVWSLNQQKFVPFAMPVMHSEKRVRIDAFDSLEDYVVYPATHYTDGSFTVTSDVPLNDYVISYT